MYMLGLSNREIQLFGNFYVHPVFFLIFLCDLGLFTYIFFPLMDSVIHRSSYLEFICTLDGFKIPCRPVIVANGLHPVTERLSNKYSANASIQ